MKRAKRIARNKPAEQLIVRQFIEYAALWKDALIKNLQDDKLLEFETQTEQLFNGIYLQYEALEGRERLNLDWTGHPSEKCLFDLLFRHYLGQLKNGCTSPKVLDVKHQLMNEKAEIHALRATWSYRIGRAITWVPRMIRGTFRTLRSDGIRAVPSRVVQKFRILNMNWKQSKTLASKNAETITRKTSCRPLTNPAKGLPYNSTAPLISVVLPTYNVAPYLEETIVSLQNQTLQNFEMIFVDDGSTDNSVSIIEHFWENDPRIKLLRQKNQYAGVARNHGIDHAKGKYVICLDPDDFFDKNMLELNYQKAEMLAADVIVFGADVYNMQNHAYESPGFLRFSSRLPQDRAFSGEDILEDVFYLLNPWTKFYRRSFIVENHLRYQALYSTNDAYFTMMAMALAKRIGALDHALVHYRINRAGGLQETKAKSPRDVYEAFMATKRDLIAHNLFATYEKPFLRKALESMFRSLDTIHDEASSRDFFEFLQREGWQSLGLHDCPKGLFDKKPHSTRYQRFLVLCDVPFALFWGNRKK